MANMNRRVLLKSRPQGEPTAANFEIVDQAIPEPAEGQALLAIDTFGLSTNNVTFAVTGDLLGYWKLELTLVIGVLLVILEHLVAALGSTWQHCDDWH